MSSRLTTNPGFFPILAQMQNIQSSGTSDDVIQIREDVTQKLADRSLQPTKDRQNSNVFLPWMEARTRNLSGVKFNTHVGSSSGPLVAHYKFSSGDNNGDVTQSNSDHNFSVEPNKVSSEIKLPETVSASLSKWLDDLTPHKADELGFVRINIDQEGVKTVFILPDHYRPVLCPAGQFKGNSLELMIALRRFFLSGLIMFQKRADGGYDFVSLAKGWTGADRFKDNIAKVVHVQFVQNVNDKKMDLMSKAQPLESLNVPEHKLEFTDTGYRTVLRFSVGTGIAPLEFSFPVDDPVKLDAQRERLRIAAETKAQIVNLVVNPESQIRTPIQATSLSNPIKIPLTRQERLRLRDAVEPPMFLGTSSSRVASIDRNELNTELMHSVEIERGEVFVPNDRTLSWIKSAVRIEGKTVVFDFAQGTTIYWYEFQSVATGMTLCLPVRFNANRLKPFVLINDPAYPPKTYQHGQDPILAKPIPQDRLKWFDQNGSWKIYLIDAGYEEDRIKAFHLSAVVSAECPLFMALVNVLDDEGSRDEYADSARFTASGLRDRSVVRFFDGEFRNLNYCASRAEIRVDESKRVINYRFYSTNHNRTGVEEWVQLENLILDDHGLQAENRLHLSFGKNESNSEKLLERFPVKISKTQKPDCFRLTEEIAEGSKDFPRVYLWLKSTGSFVQMRNSFEEIQWPHDLRSWYEKQGLPLTYPQNDDGAVKFSVRKRSYVPAPKLLFDPEIPVLPASLQSLVPAIHVVNKPDQELIDKTVLNLHEKTWLPSEESLHAMLFHGRVNEVLTWQASDGSRLSILMKVDSKNKARYTPHKTDRDKRTQGQLLASHPDQDGVFVNLPVKFYSDGVRIFALISGQQHELNFQLHATRRNVNGRQLLGLVSSYLNPPRNQIAAQILGEMKGQIEYYGLDNDQEILSATRAIGEVAVLSDQLYLDLMVSRHNETYYALNGITMEKNIRGEVQRAVVQVLDRNAQTLPPLNVMRAADDSSLFYLLDGKHVLYTLSVDDTGGMRVLKRPDNLQRLISPAGQPQVLAINQQGRTYESMAQSPAIRKRLSPYGEWPIEYRVITDFGRSQGASSAQLEMDRSSSLARAEVEFSVDASGKIKIKTARLKSEGKNKSLQLANCEIFSYEDGRVRLYIKGRDERRAAKRKYNDFAWLDFATVDDLIGSKIQVAASHYDKNTVRRHVMPSESIFGEEDYHLMMLHSAAAYTLNFEHVQKLNKIKESIRIFLELPTIYVGLGEVARAFSQLENMSRKLEQRQLDQMVSVVVRNELLPESVKRALAVRALNDLYRDYRRASKKIT